MTSPADLPATAVPTPAQLAWQRAATGMFCHFGVNTFYGREWSDGSLDPAGFDPSGLDADQWAETAAAAGMRYLVVTAKHHDGFCLWPTSTTDYSVRSSPWRAGKGDVVGEVAAACERAGIGLGIYLSPWDRNAACYSDPAAYDEFYCRQLTELCTSYGPIVETWFDGAGSQGRVYDWDAIMGVVGRHQPDAMVFNMGHPTIRWIGNEDGLAQDPCFYGVSTASLTADAKPGELRGEHYVPPECDVAIRRNWFWQPDDLDTLKSVEHLLGIYYRSVGLGANLLLDVPPDRSGRLDEADRGRLLEYAAELRRRFAEPLPASRHDSAAGVRLVFDRPVTFDHVVVKEDLTAGQRIDGHQIVADGVPVAQGRTIGATRIHPCDTTTATELVVQTDGDAGRIADVQAFLTGSSRLPDLGTLMTADSAKAQ